MGGIKLIDEPIFIKAWIQRMKHKQKVVFSIKRFEGLLIEFLEIMKKAGYKKTINKPKINPNSSTNIANIKSLWDSGIEYFNWPSPKPTPNSPPSLIADILLETWRFSLNKNLSTLVWTWSKEKYAKVIKITPRTNKMKNNYKILK